MESVADYPRPRLEPVSKRIQVVLGGITVADTTGAHRVLETTHPPTYYVCPARTSSPARSRRRAARRPFASGRNRGHFDVVAGGVRAERAAWTYPQPTAGFEPIRDAVAFYCALMDEFVDGERAEPEANPYYGGWITADIRVRLSPGAEARRRLVPADPLRGLDYGPVAAVAPDHLIPTGNPCFVTPTGADAAGRWSSPTTQSHAETTR